MTREDRMVAAHKAGRAYKLEHAPVGFVDAIWMHARSIYLDYDERTAFCAGYIGERVRRMQATQAIQNVRTAVANMTDEEHCASQTAAGFAPHDPRCAPY
jgi:hypothetical protein